MALRFRAAGGREGSAKASPGERLVYAIGDVHGCAALLDRLLARIDDDASTAGAAEAPILVFLGDYVDRGPDSRGVVQRLIELKGSARYDLRALMGNHEEALLRFLIDPAFGPTWAQYGGLQTLASYGVARPPTLRPRPEDWELTRQAFADAIPREHLTFLSDLELSVRLGDYVFVHAGVRPGIPLADQSAHDLLWIRDEFLGSSRAHDGVIVHGHTPEAEPFLGVHRIGIDTGAYATSVLTALRLEGVARNIIQVDGRRSAA